MKETKTVDGHAVCIDRTDYSVNISVGVGRKNYRRCAYGYFGNLRSGEVSEPKVGMVSSGLTSIEYAKMEVEAYSLAIKLTLGEHERFVKEHE